MIRKFIIVMTGIIFLFATAGLLAAAGQGAATASRGNQGASQTRSQQQKQIQVDKNCDGPQIKTQTRKRTNYLK